MLWIKALHIIFVICWFAGLFYLPRLFVYHAMADDQISCKRFKIMERKLYYGITWPAGVLTTIFGIWLLLFKYHWYTTQMWMHAKLILVLFLWIFHLYCGHLYKNFKKDANTRSHKFYRWINEIPTVLLIAIVILAIVQP